MPNYLKSMHKCKSYDPDKLRPFYYLTIKCDLDLHLPDQMFQMTLLHLKEKNCANLFLISMHEMYKVLPGEFMTILSVDLQVGP